MEKNTKKLACVLLSQESTYNELSRALQKERPQTYEPLITPAGTALLESQGPGPHLALVHPLLSNLKSDLAWIEARWHPARYICTGLGQPPTKLSPESLLLTPHRCVRSVSRTETDPEYVLYDEFEFDAETQSLLRSHAEPEKTWEAPLFSSQRADPGPEERQWIYEKLNCVDCDDLAGTLLHLGRRFSARVGCVRFLGAPALLEKFWLNYSDA